MPYALHYPLEEDTDSISLARTISKDSLASSLSSITPKHLLRSGPQHRLSGQSLLSHMHIEDEEEEVEEEELVAVIHPSAFPRRRLGSDMEQDELEIQSATTSSTSKLPQARRSPCHDTGPFAPGGHADSYYLEPLMPTTPKAAKEKSISLNKEEESGESHSRAAAAVRKVTANVSSTSQKKSPEANICTSTPEAELVQNSLRPPTEGSLSWSGHKQPQGFYLHLSEEPEQHSSFSTGMEVGLDSDSDIADLEEDEEEDDQMELAKEVTKRGKGKLPEDGAVCEFGEGESAKLRDDLKVSERDDKEDCSGRSSPCLSTASWASSCSASGSAGIKMTSFAERKLLKLGLRDGFSSTSSSQKTTPDGSEVATCPLWQLKSDSSSSWMGKEPFSLLGKNVAVSPSVVPSELLQLHMQLEEQRRAIEFQKKKMETLSARQRLKLGKAAFLNIVKKGGGKSDTLPLPMKHSESAELADRSRATAQSCKDDSCLDALKVQAKTGQADGGQMRGDNRLNNSSSQGSGAEPDLNECSHSIDLLNEAISSIQQQMMQLSLQQDLLMKHVVSPPPQENAEPSTAANTSQSPSPTSESRRFAVHFVDISDSNSTPARRPPKLSSSQRRKASEQKQSRENSKEASVKSSPQSPLGKNDEDRKAGVAAESSRPERSIQRNATFRVRDDHPSPKEGTRKQAEEPELISCTSASSAQGEEKEKNSVANSGKEAVGGSDNARVKGQLIEVDLSELKEPKEDGAADAANCPEEGEQKNVLGFFFKVKFGP